MWCMRILWSHLMRTFLCFFFVQKITKLLIISTEEFTQAHHALNYNSNRFAWNFRIQHLSLSCFKDSIHSHFQHFRLDLAQYALKCMSFVTFSSAMEWSKKCISMSYFQNVKDSKFIDCRLFRLELRKVLHYVQFFWVRFLLFCFFFAWFGYSKTEVGLGKLGISNC